MQRKAKKRKPSNTVLRFSFKPTYSKAIKKSFNHPCLSEKKKLK